MNELTARLSPNPIFTGLLQGDQPESAVRQLFGQLEVGHPLVETVAADVVHDPAPTLDDQFPYRASRWAGPGRRGVSPGAEWPHAAFTTFVSATPTGSINLKLRKVVENDG